MAWLRTLLQKQKKNDYKPSNDEISFARNTTEPCQACCDYLANVKEAVDEGLSGKNAEAYLTEVGVAFHRYIRTRVRMQRVVLTSAQSSPRPLQALPRQPDRRPHAHQVGLPGSL